ncbi:MAG TPA: hypothetical protein VIM75_21695 [Ohtaekwangia sp.]|uniref:hypothetical protein n=1 Tax=Ohtaekwangia sp. TaxID=2066019 RepID=UPI002F94EDFA
MKVNRNILAICWTIFSISEAYSQLIIGGPPVVCLTPDNQYTYTVYRSGSSATVSGNGCVWTLPSNAALVGGGDGQNFVNLRFTAVATGQNLSVTSTEGSATLSIDAFSVPSGTGVISGPSLVTAGQTGVTYSLSGVSPITTYGWSVPTGATITAGTNTSTITVSFPSNYGSGNVTITPVNTACPGQSVALQVASGPVPAKPAAITGNVQVTIGSTNYTYSIAAATNATSYQWSIPAGATIVSGAGTNNVSINFSTSFKGGNITVKGMNGFVEGPLSPALYVTPTGYPVQAGAISGNDSQCIEFADIVSTYSVAPISGATSYNWSVTGGATVSGTSTSNTVDIKFPASVSGNVTISVNGVNASGSGASSSKTVTINKPMANVGAGRIQPSVDLATGTMNTGISLFSISSGDIQVPVELTYAATGVRVTDDDGSVGHNWNLSALNYRIAREVRGLPDDYSASNDTRVGWLNSTLAATIKNFTPATDNNAATCGDEASNYAALSSFDTNYSKDTEPDIFYVNAPGLSFQFYFDESKVPRALPYQDVVITPNTTTGPISSFTVKDSRGVVYTFSEVETWTQSLQTPSNYYLVRQTNLYKTPITYTTSWRLSSITSPVYGSVTFTYKAINLNDPSLLPQSYRYSSTAYKYNYSVQFTDGNSALVNTLYYNRVSVIKALQKISSAEMEAVFTTTAKSATSLLERLSTISLYDKRDGTSKLIRTISLTYSLSGSDRRAFLAGVTASAGCMSYRYTMEYYPGVLPTYDNAVLTDDWGFYKGTSQALYNETVSVGSLKRLIYPYGGYDVFFYEPHTYLSSGNDVKGAGLRLKKMITYDGVSSANDRVQEYQYVRVDSPLQGKSSGKLQYNAQHKFSVTRLANGMHYRDYPQTPKQFDLKSSLELSLYGPFRGSAVAYERVVVKERNNGQSIYEFDLSGWNDASVVSVARPSTGTSSCYELANVQQGIGQYPFPPDPNHDFEKALLKKLTNLTEAGVKERDVVYTYQRVYRNGSSIQKIYGLALEEMPTYYYNGSSNVDAKMLLYSKYEILTEVKTEIASQTETIYNSDDGSKNTVTRIDYWFESPNHGAVTRMETTNSDGSVARKKFKYSKDYLFTSASGTAAVALNTLNSVNRFAPVETITSIIVAGAEKTIDSELTIYQTLNGKIYPYQQYSFTSTDGTTAFTPSSVSGGSTFQFDQTNYTLQSTILNADSYGNVTETVGKDKSSNAVAFGYSGTLPIIQVSNAGINEIKYSDFETSSSVNPTIGWGNPVYVTGRNNSKGLLMPPGSQGNNTLVNQLTHNYIRPRDYIVSIWIKAQTPGNISVVAAGPGLTSPTFTFPFIASNDYQYYQFRIPVASLGSTGPTLVLIMYSTVTINIDDVAAYPDQSDFVASTYVIPNGKSSETDARGVSNYFDNDVWGRLKAAYDQDKNLVKKIDYQVKP